MTLWWTYACDTELFKLNDKKYADSRKTEASEKVKKEAADGFAK